MSDDRCKFFNGLVNISCLAGVAYKDVLNISTMPTRMPCFKSHGCSSTCAHVSYEVIEKSGPQIAFMCKREVKK